MRKTTQPQSSQLGDDQSSAKPLDVIRVSPAEQKLSVIVDDKAKQEELALANAQREADIEHQRLENRDLEADISARKKFSGNLFVLLCIWLFVVIGIVLGVGLKALHLSDKVLIALITSTTVNIIALFKGVTEHMFHRGTKANATREADKSKPSIK